MSGFVSWFVSGSCPVWLGLVSGFVSSSYSIYVSDSCPVCFVFGLVSGFASGSCSGSCLVRIRFGIWVRV